MCLIKDIYLQNTLEDSIVVALNRALMILRRHLSASVGLGCFLFGRKDLVHPLVL